MHVIGGVLRRDAFGRVREQVGHGVARNNDHDVAGPRRAPLVGRHDARAGRPPYVGRPQEHRDRGVLLRKRAAELRSAIGAQAHQICGLGDHDVSALISTNSLRGPHSKKVGTFS